MTDPIPYPELIKKITSDVVERLPRIPQISIGKITIMLACFLLVNLLLVIFSVLTLNEVGYENRATNELLRMQNREIHNWRDRLDNKYNQREAGGRVMVESARKITHIGDCEF